MYKQILRHNKQIEFVIHLWDLLSPSVLIQQLLESTMTSNPKIMSQLQLLSSTAVFLILLILVDSSAILWS